MKLETPPFCPAMKLRSTATRPWLISARISASPASAAEWMIRIVADIVEKRGSGGDDLFDQKRVGAIKFQQRRQLIANFAPQRSHGLCLRQRTMHRAQQIIEQTLMPALLDEGAQRS